MMNLSRQRRRSPLAVTFIVALMVSVALFSVDALSGGFVRSYVRTLSSLAWGAASGASRTLEGTGYFASRRALVEENSALKDRIAFYEERDARYRSLEIENAALRDIAAFAQSDEGTTVRVLSSFTTSPYGTFVLGAGERAGLSRGDIVLTPGGFALGRISDLDSHTAVVDSLFSPGNTIEVIVRDFAFSVDGRGGGNARAEIPRGADVAVGDAAHVPEYGGRVAGIIGAIESASSSATQTLFIRLPQGLDTLRFVYVVPAE